MRLAMMARIFDMGTSSPGCGAVAGGLLELRASRERQQRLCSSATAVLCGRGCPVLVMRPEAPVPGTGREIDVVLLRDLADQRRRADASPALLRLQRLRQGREPALERSEQQQPGRAAAGAAFRAAADDGDDGVDGDGRALRDFDLGEGAGNG